MGQATVRDLVESPEVSQVILGDINLGKANEFAARVKSQKLSVEQIDVSDHKALVKLLKRVDAAANMTLEEYMLAVQRAAIEAKVNICDPAGYFAVKERFGKDMLGFDDDAKEAGITIVSCIGVSPGLTDVAAACGANNLDEVEEVHVRIGALGEDMVPGELLKFPYDFATMLWQSDWPDGIFSNGEIIGVPPHSGKEIYKFPEPIGEQEGYYVKHSEIYLIPRTIKSVKRVDYRDFGLHKVFTPLRILAEYGLTGTEPIKVKDTTITPREFLSACFQGRATTRDSFCIITEVVGKKDGKETRYTYQILMKPNERWDLGGMALGTGVPPSVTAQMLARGDIKRKGVLSPEEAFDHPELFIAELAKRGFETVVTKKTHEPI